MNNAARHVSVKQALWRGACTVNLPILVIIVAPWLLTLYMTAEVLKTAGIPSFLTTILLVLSLFNIPLAWLWWSYAIPKWKLWAYARAEDVDTLKHAAVDVGLIWPDGHIFEKTEICSQDVRKQILKLEGRPS